MVALELVDDGIELGIGPADDREDRPILEPVVGFDEAAVAQAAEAQLPEDARRLERPDPLADLLRRGAAGRVLGEQGHVGEVAPDHRVHGAQLVEERVVGHARDCGEASGLANPRARYPESARARSAGRNG